MNDSLIQCRFHGLSIFKIVIFSSIICDDSIKSEFDILPVRFSTQPCMPKNCIKEKDPWWSKHVNQSSTFSFKLRQIKIWFKN